MSSARTAEPALGAGFAVVVVAAGSGTRLGLGIPKALAPLAGGTLLEHALEGVAASGVAQGPGGRVLVTVPAGDRRLGELARAAGAEPVVGGGSRADSVRRALEALQAGLEEHPGQPRPAGVLVHDAARCLTPPKVFRAVAQAVADSPVRRGLPGAAVPVQPVADTMRAVAADGALGEVVDREGLRAMQTPQGFDLALLCAANERSAAAGEDPETLTDDAALVQRCTEVPVEPVSGHAESFKITRPLDLLLARAVLQERSQHHEP